jgi:hypothetical protein
LPMTKRISGLAIFIGKYAIGRPRIHLSKF